MEEFSVVLKRLRNLRGFTQRYLANPDVGLTYSYIAQLEVGLRGKNKLSLTRKQIWHFVERLTLSPQECDELLSAAHMDLSRDPVEEQQIRKHLLFSEVWEFCRYINFENESWYSTIKVDLQKGKAYRYFIPIEISSSFSAFRKKLGNDNVKKLEQHLECIFVPREFFLSNFTLLLLDNGKIIGSGAKVIDAASVSFYTLDSSQTAFCYDVVREFRARYLLKSVKK